MPSSRILIASNTLSSSAASVTFSSIPATYTDLVCRVTARGTSTTTTEVLRLELNADASSLYSYTLLGGDGTSAFSSRGSALSYIENYYTSADGATANTFGSLELYLPSYTASQNKPMSVTAMAENNVSAVKIGATAGLYRSTSAITSIKFTFASNNIASGSSFFLYGLKNS